MREDALTIVRTLRNAGHVAYFAGGCVRDLLMGLTPKDYDVVTDAPPERVRCIFPKTQAVGQAFGVILVRVGQSVIEVATFRADGEYHDGRRPASVRFTTPEQDAHRRDFSINGLFLDPIDNCVIDFVRGQDDLMNRVLRAIGDPAQRFAEDYLRLLRAVRFLSRFNLLLDPTTAQAIRRHAQNIQAISPERVADELRLMMTAQTRGAAWEWLNELELAENVFRLWPMARGRTNDRRWRLIETITPNETIQFGLALAAIYVARTSDLQQCFRPLAVKDLVRSSRQLLKLSNDESSELGQLLLGCNTLLSDKPLSLAQKKRFLLRPTERLTGLLLGALAEIGYESGRINRLLAELRELRRTDFAPPPFVTGDDLAALGLPPGPAYKKVLDHVYDEQLEGRITDKREALNLSRTTYGKADPLAAEQ